MSLRESGELDAHRDINPEAPTPGERRRVGKGSSNEGTDDTRDTKDGSKESEKLGTLVEGRDLHPDESASQTRPVKLRTHLSNNLDHTDKDTCT